MAVPASQPASAQDGSGSWESDVLALLASKGKPPTNPPPQKPLPTKDCAFLWPGGDPDQELPEIANIAATTSYTASPLLLETALWRDDDWSATETSAHKRNAGPVSAGYHSLRSPTQREEQIELFRRVNSTAASRILIHFLDASGLSRVGGDGMVKTDLQLTSVC